MTQLKKCKLKILTIYAIINPVSEIFFDKTSEIRLTNAGKICESYPQSYLGSRGSIP